MNNIYDIYMQQPGHYIVSASGGFGKTTQLVYMTRELLYGDEKNRTVDGKICIPIYIRLKDLNTKNVRADILYQMIADNFNNSVSLNAKNAVDDMFDKTENSYQYIILLDGFNEVKDYTTENGEGQTIYNHLFTDITYMAKRKNVHFIISTRNIRKLAAEIEGNEDIQNIFQYRKVTLEGLKEKEIFDYLGEEAPGPHLRELLKVPMMIKIFNEIFKTDPEGIAALKSKFDILHKWVMLDINKRTERRDNDDEFRKIAVQKILPCFALKMQMYLMEDEENSGRINQEELMNYALDAANIHGSKRNRIVKSIGRMTLLEDDKSFKHDMIRDYFTAAYMISSSNTLKDETRDLFSELCDRIDENNTKFDPDYVDLAEIIYGASEYKSIEQFFYEDGYGSKEAKKEAKEKEFEFLFKLAGTYEIIKEDWLAYILGWKAADMFSAIIEKTDDHYETARKYNFLYYCVLHYIEKNEKRDPLVLLNKAKDYMEKVETTDRNRKYDILWGKILSNTGAYYISDYCMDPEKSKEWHMEALTFRKNKGLVDFLHATYRSLMRVCFHYGTKLKTECELSFRHAYYYYCAAVKARTGMRRLSEAVNQNLLDDIKEAVAKDLKEVVLGVIGNEIQILSEVCSLENYGLADWIRDDWIRTEILKELPYQIEFVYSYSTRRKRRDYNSLDDLRKKLNELINLDGVSREEILERFSDNHEVRSWVTE